MITIVIMTSTKLYQGLPGLREEGTKEILDIIVRGLLAGILAS